MKTFLTPNFLQTINAKRILLAVSGGVDSMVLLDCVSKARTSCKFYAEVIHINHNLRGDESNSDAELVLSVSQKLGFKATIKSIDVMSNKLDQKQTIEESARNLRLAAIWQFANDGNFDYVIFAHNAGDQAETVLMHIARGSGLAGAVGIRETFNCLRPLLGVSKEEIYEYAQKHKVRYHEDSSNKEIVYARNFVRHEVLPRLKRIYSSVEANLCKFAAFAEQDETYIQSTIDYSVIKQVEDGFVVDVNIFDQHSAVYSRILRQIMKNFDIFADFEQRHVQMIKDLSQMKNGTTICLPYGIFAIKEYNNVKFTNNDNKKIQITNKNYHIGNIELSDDLMVMIKEVSADEVCFGDGNLYFDLDSIPSSAVFRQRKTGDKFKRFGSGEKSLSDYLTDKKVSHSVRNSLFVLAKDCRVLLIVGGEISDNIKITDGTTRFGQLSIVQKNDNCD